MNNNEQHMWKEIGLQKKLAYFSNALIPAEFPVSTISTILSLK